jgi:NAD(P)H-hydrate epimerase
MWIGTAAQCRELDRIAIEELGVAAADLMEAAGTAVFEAVKEVYSEGAVLVACGPGNNGGDGLVVARLLKQAGIPVDVYVAGAENKLSEVSKGMLGKAKFAGVEPVFYGSKKWASLEEKAAEAAIIVDALLGTGQIGEPTGPVRETVITLHDSYATVVAVDVPTGIVTDTGDAPGAYVDADLTVSFEMAKPCFFQGIGAEAVGDWSVVEIGYPEAAHREPTGMATLDDPTVIATLGERSIASHKGENGHVLILAGSYGKRGAAILAAQGALHAGAGLVTVAAIVEVCDALAAIVPEAMMVPLEDEGNGVIGPDSAEVLLDLQDSMTCTIFGPGLTTHESVRALLQRVWSEWGLPSVIDADALNAISLGLALPNAPCILTPHPGEMARLLGMSSEKVQSDRFGAVALAVEKYKRTVLLKGAYSVAGDTEGHLLVNTTGNPGMASGGMGDVLSGVIAGLLAQGLPAMQAASVGAYLHGAAGDLCAEQLGPVGYVASDVATMLPAARAKLELWYQD